MAVLSYEALRILVEKGLPQSPKELKAPDWIYDGILFPPESSSSGVLVTAHNEIVPILEESDGKVCYLGPLTSPSRPILYSANLCLLDPDTVLIAGGTVFGEIIVWKCNVEAARPPRYEVLFVFTGHEGSVFGVSISPELELAPDVKVRLLASCSDDRTIRIWDITDRTRSALHHQGDTYSKTLTEARETGFGDNSEAKAENSDDSSRCIAVEMGHASRIWHAKFTGQTNHHLPQASPVEIYSFGEDASRQRWELSLDLSQLRSAPTSSNHRAGSGSRRIGTLKNCSISVCHVGKNIWSTAVLTTVNSLLIASGGSDGRVVISEKQNDSQATLNGQHCRGSRRKLKKCGDIDVSLQFKDFIQSVIPVVVEGGAPEANYVTEPAKEGFHRYAFLSEDTLLVTSASGRLFLGSIGDSLEWKEYQVARAIRLDLSSFQVVKSPAPGVAMLGSASGKLYVFTESLGIRELASFSSKITDIIPLGRGDGLPKKDSIVVTVLGQDHAEILHYDGAAGTATKDSRNLRFDENYSHYVLTSASYCGRRRLLLGSRVGVLTLYASTDDCFSILDSRKDPKNKDAVTAILPLPGSSTSFLATCRDGRYRIYNICDSGGNAKLVLQHEISPPVSIIEGASFAPSTTGSLDLVLYGFRSQKFVVWNETARHELVAIECGGAHRPFDCVWPPGDPGKLRFVCTKTSQMLFRSQSQPHLQVLKEGGHGREIRSVAACSDYVATAAEDTTIRIWQYRDNPDARWRGFDCLAVLEKHSAGIQTLKWHGNNHLLSSAGNEELYIWHVTRLESDYQALAVVCEAVYPDRSADGDLRIMNFDVQGWSGSNNEGLLLISLALSNSIFKTYLYSKEIGFRLLSTGHYTGACLTQLRHLSIGEDAIHVLTAATDGYIAIWTSRRKHEGAEKLDFDEFGLTAITKLHQSTIKSLDICIEESTSGSRWLVVTGGDDNILGFLDLEGINALGEVRILGKYRIKSAHAAAVTGLSILRAKAGVMDVATASNDQRVKVWRAARNGHSGRHVMRVAMVENRYSSVADAGDLEVIAPGRLMVGGVGMEVWDV